MCSSASSSPSRVRPAKKGILPFFLWLVHGLNVPSCARQEGTFSLYALLTDLAVLGMGAPDPDERGGRTGRAPGRLACGSSASRRPEPWPLWPAPMASSGERSPDGHCPSRGWCPSAAASARSPASSRWCWSMRVSPCWPSRQSSAGRGTCFNTRHATVRARADLQVYIFGPQHTWHNSP